MITLRDYQVKAVQDIYQYLVENDGNPVVVAPTGCHEKGTGIMMHDGSIKLVEDISIGDLVMGGDGTPRTVIDLHHGTDMMYRITPTKGDPFVVNGGHILSLITTPTHSDRRWKSEYDGTEVHNISVYDYLSKSKTFKHTHKLYRGMVKDFCSTKELEMPPYVLGLMLGDGSFCYGDVTYTNPDLETYKELQTWANSIGCELRLSFNTSNCPTLHFKGKERFTRGKATYSNILKALGLRGVVAENKFIPQHFKTASWKDRLDLIAGLIDTDGNLSNSDYDFVSKSKALAEDLVFLCRSVGLAAYVKECLKKCQTGFEGTYWRVCISGDTDIIPCRVKRKVAKQREQKKRVNVTGFSVEEIGLGEYFGFECDGDHLYMMEDFTVTHNSGKSMIIATFISEMLRCEPQPRLLLLTHQKELIEQDLAKLQALLPEADMGIYSASIGEKDASHQVTFASIQSIAKRTDLHFDGILVDECHLINNKDEGQYQSFLKAMGCRVIGFTATPYRLGQGQLVEDGSLFTDYIETVGIADLQRMGYLSRLTTKATAHELDTRGVGKAMGEFKQGELQKKVNVYTTNDAVTDEIVESLDRFDRHHCMIFCTGVEHAHEISNLLNSKGIYTVCVEGSMSKQEREFMLSEFTSGVARCITNCAVLTTGFDYPDVDCIAMLRPTLSPGLYMQILGRGLRIAEGKQNCLVLDFAGNVMRHGPITAVKPPKRHEKGEGVAPMKVCPDCLEIVPSQTHECPSCGHEFPRYNPIYELYMGNVNGDEQTPHLIEKWTWVEGSGRKDPHYTRWEVTMIGYDGTDTIKEYIITDDRMTPFIRKMSAEKMFRYCTCLGVPWSDFVNPNVPKGDPRQIDWHTMGVAISQAGPPAIVVTKPNAKNPNYTDIVGMMSEKEVLADQERRHGEQARMERLHPEMV